MKKIKSNILSILLTTIIFSLITMVVQYFSEESQITTRLILINSFYIFGMVTIGSFSYEFLIKAIAERICSDNKAILRFLIKTVGVAIITIPISSLFILLCYIIFLGNNAELTFFSYLFSNIFITVIINYSFLLSDEAVYWYKTWKRIVIDKNNIQKETYRLEYENLKGHINPHFMFNSFAGLTSYIEKDKDEAIRYVEELSDFFRNILLYKSSELIPLEEELTIAKTYFKLEQRRHKEAIKLIIEVDSLHLSSLIPPMSLQILLENAIKHNSFSNSEPLNIDILSKNEYLSVMNPFRPMENTYTTTKTGLKNLINTYRLFTDQEVKIEKNNDLFSVKIPLISNVE